MKKWLWIFIFIAFISLLCMLVNMFITPVPDWLIRTAGIITLVSLVVITYTTVRISIERKK